MLSFMTGGKNIYIGSKILRYSYEDILGLS